MNGWPRGVLPALLAAIASPAPAASDPPAFTLALIGGGRVASAELRGEVVVIAYWATWCAPCRQELAELDAFVTSRRGVRAVAVLAERRPDPRLLARQRAAIRIPIATGFAEGGAAFPLVGAGVPTTYVLDRDGRIAAVKSGAFRPGELARTLEPVLARP